MFFLLIAKRGESCFLYCRTPNVAVIIGQFLAIIKKREIVERGSFFNLYEDGLDDVYQYRISPVLLDCALEC